MKLFWKYWSSRWISLRSCVQHRNTTGSQMIYYIQVLFNYSITVCYDKSHFYYYFIFEWNKGNLNRETLTRGDLCSFLVLFKVSIAFLFIVISVRMKLRRPNLGLFRKLTEALSAFWRHRKMINTANSSFHSVPYRNALWNCIIIRCIIAVEKILLRTIVCVVEWYSVWLLAIFLYYLLEF